MPEVCRMKLSVVVSTHQASFEAVSFKGAVSESMAAVAAAGYDGAELAVRNAGEVSAPELKAIAASHNLGIPAVGTGQMWGDERLSLTAIDEKTRRTAVTRIKEHIALAAELNAFVIIGLVRGVFPDAQYRDASWEWLVEELRELGSAADAVGVGIAIEAINRYETAYVNAAADGLRLLERVGRESIGLLLDTFHMNIEEPDMVESIRICGDRLFHFHVADSNRWYPGAGHIDFPLLINTLLETGYNGWVSGEFLPRPDAATSIAKGLEYLRSIA
jgi:sugar phosphate isomerase/epimerase